MHDVTDMAATDSSNLLMPKTTEEPVQLGESSLPKLKQPVHEKNDSLDKNVIDKFFEMEKSALEKDIESAVSDFEKKQLVAKHKELLEKVSLIIFML